MRQPEPSAHRCGHAAVVAMTATDFLDALARDVPETQPVVVEHLEDNDGLLLYLLTAGRRDSGPRPIASGANASRRPHVGMSASA